VDFYVSTGEGLLWHGRITDNLLQPLSRIVTCRSGVAPVFDWRASTSMLALADHDIRIFLPVEALALP
jgi:hypothetical protein